MAQQYTEARKKANKKWDAANLDRLSICLPKGTKAEIKELADARGESVNGFIKRVLLDSIKKEKGLG